MKPTIQIKRIYDDAGSDDGWRVLVDRLWPRGVSKEAARLDDWQKEVAPTTELREWFSHQPERFDEFRKRYREELSHSEALPGLMKELATKPKVTLLYGAHDPIHNQAVVLQEYLKEKLANT
jgi:uncharacterized protein YeaO (DUF488 family)